MHNNDGENTKITGWEISQYKDKLTIRERLSFSKDEIKASFIALIALIIMFFVGCWLAGNPIAGTERIFSKGIINQHFDFTGNNWSIIWDVVFLAIIFEFLDSAAGMGYGTAFTPVLLILGYEPLQIVPVIMIQQACAGLTSAYIHNAHGNVEWKFSPMSETTKLWLIIATTGSLGVILSISSVYAIISVSKFWIKLYVSLLLLCLGVFSLVKAKRTGAYHPKRMLFYGCIAGINKGISGGGYGPVITLGGLFSGVPAKSMIAITALSEGTVCLVSIFVWFYLLGSGIKIDFILLPSMILGSIIAILLAPYAIKVLPEKLWRYFVPGYCCLLGIYSVYKLLIQ